MPSKSVAPIFRERGTTMVSRYGAGMAAQMLPGSVVSLHRIVLALVACLAANHGHASDWQYAGYAKANAIDTHQFFDAESVSRPTKGLVRFWIKAIRVRDLDSYSKIHEKIIVEKAAQKIAANYSPKFLQLPAIRA